MRLFKKRGKRPPMWEEVQDTFSGLQCNFIPKCPACNTETPTTLFDIKNLSFNVNQVQVKRDGASFDPRGLDSHATDVAMMCMECGYHDIFGVAIEFDHSLRNYDLMKEHVEEESGKDFDEAVKEIDAREADRELERQKSRRV